MVNKAPGVPKPIMEGENSEDWVCVDGGYVFLNVFSPEGRVHWDLDRKFLFEYLEDSQLSEEEMKKF